MIQGNFDTAIKGHDRRDFGLFLSPEKAQPQKKNGLTCISNCSGGLPCCLIASVSSFSPSTNKYNSAFN